MVVASIFEPVDSVPYGIPFKGESRYTYVRIFNYNDAALKPHR